MDVDIYKDGWNDINAYIFGIIMSDGCLKWEGRNKNRLAIRIGLNDLDMIEHLHSIMCVGNQIYRQGKQFSIKYRNESSIGFLMGHGLTTRKSLTMRFPDVPEEFVGSFVRGYFDGDGSLSLTKTKNNIYGQVSFASGSKGFLTDMREILSEKFNIESRLYPDGRKTNRSFYLKVLRRSEIEKLYLLMYHDSSLHLDRKHDKFIELKKHPLKYKITSNV